MPTVREINQIVEKVFPFVRAIPDIPTIQLDELREEAGSMGFLAEGTNIINKNVIGGYTADFNFSIYYRVSAKDTKSKFEATRVLNYIADYLQQKSEKKELPYLNELDEAQYIEMSSNPQLMQNEENANNVYVCSFFMRYEHKSTIGGN